MSTSRLGSRLAGLAVPIRADPRGATVTVLGRLGRQADARCMPSADFRDALRQRLVAAAAASAAATVPVELRHVTAVQTLAAPRRCRRWIRPGIALAALAVILVALMTLSTRALPGQPMYSLKRTMESVQLGWTHGDEARGRLELSFARTRLHEVAALSHGQTLAAAGGLTAGGSASGTINRTLQDMDDATRSATAYLLRAAGEGHSRATGYLTTFAVRQQHDLATLLPELPTPSRYRAQRSQALIASTARSAVATEAALAIAPGPPVQPESQPTVVPAAPTPSTELSARSSTQPSTQPSAPPSRSVPAPLPPPASSVATTRPMPALPLPSVPLPSIPIALPVVPTPPVLAGVGPLLQTIVRTLTGQLLTVTTPSQ